MTGIYIHIPYCKRKCNYCDFYSLTALDTKSAYLNALKNEMTGFQKTDIDSIYFGGGTPSLLTADEVADVLVSLRQHFSVSNDCEVTLEMNPASCDSARIRALREAGINRLSIGIQSFNDRSLSVLGRLHDEASAKRAIADAKAAGFKNISADLMLALPNEEESDIARAVGALAEGGVSHISAYLLKIMEKTPFFEKTPPGIPDDDRQAELYSFAVDALQTHEFQQYEISNFAKPGFESRHNLKYWNCEDYIGLGAAAHTSVGGRRYSYPADISRFIADFSAPCDDAIPLFTFEGDVDGEDYIMMRLRTTTGLDTGILKERFGVTLEERTTALFKQYEAAGMANFDGRVFSLTKKGLLVSNSIIVSILSRVENDKPTI